MVSIGSGRTVATFREDHVQAEGGERGAQGQHALRQCSEKMTYFLRAENGEHKVSMRFGSVPIRSRTT